MQATLITSEEARRGQITEPWGTLRWVADHSRAEVAGLTLGRVTLNPGYCNPRHSHPNCDEVLHVLSGTMEHSVRGEVFVLRAGDTR